MSLVRKSFDTRATTYITWDCINQCELITSRIGKSKGDARDTCPPLGLNSFIFMQFWGIFWPKNRLAPPVWGLAPPPLENPGSATVTCPPQDRCNNLCCTNPLYSFPCNINLSVQATAETKLICEEFIWHFVLWKYMVNSIILSCPLSSN